MSHQMPEGAEIIKRLHEETDPWKLFDVVHAAELTQFINLEERRVLGQRLLEIASEHRFATSAATQRAVWSALRTLSSLFESKEEIAKLIVFLEPDVPLGNRIAALGRISRVLEVYGPALSSDPKVTEVYPILFAIRDTLNIYMNPLAFLPGEVGALVINGIVAIAALGDSFACNYIENAAHRLKKPWIFRQIKYSLKEIRDAWEKRNFDAYSLNRSIELIESIEGKQK